MENQFCEKCGTPFDDGKCGMSCSELNKTPTPLNYLLGDFISKLQGIGYQIETDKTIKEWSKKQLLKSVNDLSALIDKYRWKGEQNE